MEKTAYKLLKWVFLSAFSFFVFVYIKNAVQPELHYHAKQPPFILDWGFFASFLRFPGGLSKYIANFLSQTFYYKWLGALVFVMAGIMLQQITHSTLNTPEKPAYAQYLAYLPWVLALALFNNYYFPFAAVVRILSVIAALRVFKSVLDKNTGYLVAVFSTLGLLVYYVSGSGPLLVFSLTASILLPLDGKNRKTCLAFLAFAAVLTFVIDFVSYKYVFALGKEKAFFSFLPDIDVFMDALLNYRPGFVFYLFCLAMPAIGILLLLMKNAPKPTKPVLPNKRPMLKHLVFFTGIAVFSFVMVKITFDKHEKNRILSDYFCCNKKWKDVVDIAQSAKQYDKLINYSYNRAIDHWGTYPDLFFKYPQHHDFALFPDRVPKGNSAFSQVVSDYYFDLGYISLSHHWAQASLVLMPHNPRVLKRLALTNLVYGNYKAAQNYLNVLSKTLVSKKFVEQYMPYTLDTNLVAKDRLIMEKRSFMPQSKKIPDNIAERFQDLLARNKNNRRAFDHLQLSYLVSYDLHNFMKNLQSSTDHYKQMPKIYEQALLMYVAQTNSQNLSKVNVSSGSRETFTKFVETINQNKHDLELARPKLARYSNTYMYYVAYFFPLAMQALNQETNPSNKY